MTSDLSFFEASLTETKRLIVVAKKNDKPRVASVLVGAVAELEREIKQCKEAIA